MKPKVPHMDRDILKKLGPDVKISHESLPARKDLAAALNKMAEDIMPFGNRYVGSVFISVYTSSNLLTTAEGNSLGTATCIQGNFGSMSASANRAALDAAKVAIQSHFTGVELINEQAWAGKWRPEKNLCFNY